MLTHTTIANSEKTKKDIAFLPFIKHKIKVITLSIDAHAPLPRNEAREKLHIPSDVFCIGTGTELHTNKGIDIVIEAVQKFDDVLLAIIGGGDKEQELKAQVNKLGIGHRVIFLGVVPNVRQYMSAFDMYVLNSRTESFGYSILEAGLAELPVVAAKVGGIPEIIDHEKNGLLVPPENPDATAQALTQLIDNPNQAKRLGLALKKKVETTFSFEQMLEKTIAIYSAPTNSRPMSSR